MQKDSIGNIWISTNNGLSCFDPSNNMFRNYTVDDGLSGNEFNRFETFVMANGELIFGGVDGFVIFNPQQVLREKIVSNIVFTGISIFDKPLQWKIDSKNIQAPIGYANHLTLQPGQNVFSISFASLEYRSNSRKNYSINSMDLMKLDKSSPKHEVTYTNLSPGTYTFHVKGSNSNVTWSKNPISMEIIVLPYWYQTLWFKLILLSIITLIMWNIVRFRLQQELKVEKLRNQLQEIL
ncbi:MAG: hypothetical protein IPL95_16700 [Saprospiraceae bacterium]|nr:hypothetical protein [Saprospiraceae bacterium]